MSEPSPPSAPAEDHTWGRSILLLLGLHAVTALRLPTEAGSWFGAFLRPGPDLAWIVTAACLAILVFGRLGVARWLFAVLLVLWVALRAGSSFAERVYTRRFDLYDDLEFIGGLSHLFLHERPRWQQLTIQAAGGALILALLWALARAAGPLLRPLRPRSRAALGVVAGLSLGGLVILLRPSEEAESGRQTLFNKEARFGVLPRYAVQLTKMPAKHRVVVEFGQRLEEQARGAWKIPRDLEGLGGADVHVLFIESYGRVLTRTEAGRALLDESLSAIEHDPALQEFGVRSSFLTPSVNGGMSSLAHAEFLSGVPISTRRLFMKLLQSSVEPLPRAFLEAGYRTVNVQPAMYEDWPVGLQVFGFSNKLFLDDFDYAGIEYPWGTMPDQFALARFLELRPEGLKVPIFSMYVSVSSHMPFAMIPPYYADWDEALEPGAFAGEPAERFEIGFADYMGNPNAEQGYLAAIRYSLETLRGFLGELERPSLVFVLGDHQPPKVSGLSELDTSRDVPIHAYSNRPELLRRLEPLGFVEGNLAPEDHLARPSAEFSNRFLQAMSGRGQ